LKIERSSGKSKVTGDYLFWDRNPSKIKEIAKVFSIILLKFNG